MAIGIGYGKIIFFGEHFVVYGCEAIGFGLNKKIEVEIVNTPSFEIVFKADEKVKKAIKIFQKQLGIKNFSVKITNTDIPIASGLGSGAALSVAIIRALSNEFNLRLTNKQVCSLTFEAEKLFHGTPSGIDNTLATFGGAIIFKKRQRNNLIKHLLVGSPLHLVIINTGIKSGTKYMVDKVLNLKDKNPAVFLKIMDAEKLIVKMASNAINKGEIEKIGALMNANHGLLNAIGVSHIENERIVAIARENGALGAKLVGAGGGGFCMALMEDKESALKLVEIMGKQYHCFYNLIPASQPVKIHE